MTLTEFLLARIAEDELDALRCRNLGAGLDDLTGWVEMGSREVDAAEALFARFSPARVLAECAAKRRIVERYQAQLDRQGDPEESQLSADICVTEYDYWILPALALPFADHADFDPEWRP